MKALYELSRRIPGFDFFIWQAMQIAGGATEIVFDTRNPRTNRWPEATVMERFRSILQPGPALAGLRCSEGTVGKQFGGYTQPELIKLVRGGLKVSRLRSVLPVGTEKYTVTLRKEGRMPERNSNDSAWRTFAREIGARVIEDYEVEQIHLHERMALYAGAEMNFFVTNGPVMLCFLSEYPAMGFDVQNSPPQGIEPGGQYPWLLPDRHRQIWEKDELPTIWKHFEAWQKSRWV